MIDRNAFLRAGCTESEIDIISRSMEEISSGKALRSHDDVMRDMRTLRDQYLLANA
jgi:hypothetical protein